MQGITEIHENILTKFGAIPYLFNSRVPPTMDVTKGGHTGCIFHG